MVHHKVHDKRGPRWAGAARGSVDRSCIPEHGRDPEHGRQRRAGGAGLAERDKAFAKVPRRGRARVDGGAGEPRVLASRRRGRWPYDDQNVSDEFYWAAAELYLTTHKPAYKDFLTVAVLQAGAGQRDASGADAGLDTSMTWGNVQSLGSISLAVVPSPLGPMSRRSGRTSPPPRTHI